jgi:hypothetical protein
MWFFVANGRRSIHPVVWRWQSWENLAALMVGVRALLIIGKAAATQSLRTPANCPLAWHCWQVSRMHSGQWEFRRGVVIEFATLPLRGGVAGLTRGGESRRPVVGVHRRIERRHVAPVAGLRRTGEYITNVALLAGHGGVLACEGELGRRVVVERTTRPLRSVVTGFTGCPPTCEPYDLADWWC